MKKLFLIIPIAILITACGSTPQVSDSVNYKSPAPPAKSSASSTNDFFTIKSYDVNGNPIEEKLKITNVYRKLPLFINPTRSPSPGTHFECVEYSLDHNPTEEFFYINIYVQNFEGETITYQGQNYSQRTYDYFDLITENNQQIYCYYEIPDGLTKYSLEFINEIEPNSNQLHLLIPEP